MPRSVRAVLFEYKNYAVAYAAFLAASFLPYLSRWLPSSTMAALSGQQAKLTELPKSERLSPLVHRVLGCNPSPYTLQGTNTYLVGSGNRKILIDTGEGMSEYVDTLKGALSWCDASIDTIVCTHWHADHVGGLADVTSKVAASGSSVEAFKFRRPNVTEGQFKLIQDGHIFKTEGATLRALFTPGHTSDHISLVLDEEGAVFSGDCILGEGTTVFEDLYDYMLSLDKLLELKPKRIYPGHGPVIENPVEKIMEYIKHRNKREEQILTCLMEKSQETEMSAMEIVDNVYEGIAASVKLGAVSNVRHHLSKLLKEEKVTKVAADLWKYNQR